jgi:hypothetical protein
MFIAYITHNEPSRLGENTDLRWIWGLLGILDLGDHPKLALGFVDFSHVAKAVVGVNTNFFERLGILGEDILSALNKK